MKLFSFNGWALYVKVSRLPHGYRGFAILGKRIAWEDYGYKRYVLCIYLWSRALQVSLANEAHHSFVVQRHGPHDNRV